MGWAGGYFTWINFTGYVYLACNSTTENGFLPSFILDET